MNLSEKCQNHRVHECANQCCKFPSWKNSEVTSKQNGLFAKLPLFLFITLYISFCCFGAICFNKLERPTERRERLRLHASQIRFLRTHSCVTGDELNEFVEHVVAARKMRISMTPVKNLSTYSSIDIPENWYEDFHLGKSMEVNAKFEAVAMDDLKEEERNESDWNFYEAIFFVTTVITTIGYGTTSPITPYGKAFCIFLVCAGIPMNMILVSALASICMSVVRKSRNALVNFRFPSRDCSVFVYKDNENLENWDSDIVSKAENIQNEKTIRKNEGNKHGLAKLCFKPKCCCQDEFNISDEIDESHRFQKWLSDCHLAKRIEKQSFQTAEFEIRSLRDDTIGKESLYKTVSSASSSTSLPEIKPAQKSFQLKHSLIPNSSETDRLKPPSTSSHLQKKLVKKSSVVHMDVTNSYTKSQSAKDANSSSNFTGILTTENTLVDRARLSCITFLHFLLSRSDLALTTKVRFSQLRYRQGHHGIFHIRLCHFFVLFWLVVMFTIFTPAVIFFYLEHNWTYLDAVYFCVISLSSVGLGDLVPSQDGKSNTPNYLSQSYVKNIYKIMTAVYLVLGTTLVTVLVRSFREIIDYEFTNVTCTLEENNQNEFKSPSPERHFEDTLVSTPNSIDRQIRIDNG
ncbi:unnamed protein product [Heterobilharzia americana]|nr:unnamed protein product [Heterobilharzia americana]